MGKTRADMKRAGEGRKKNEHKFIGVITLAGYRWCAVCDKWVKVKKGLTNAK